MKISVAMCTYDGEKYVEEQIISILSQTIVPDEIVIFDDGSTDNTGRIIKAVDNPIIKFHQNKVNVGVTKNFEQAIKGCSGDIIFFSDQDDVWLPNKIETIIGAFDHHLEAYMIFTDAYLTNEKLEPFRFSLWESINFDYHKFDRSMLMSHFVAAGTTMAIKKEALKFIFPFPDNMFHDAWITLILTFLGHTIFINEKLVYYRQSENQQVGVRIKKNKVKRHSKFTKLKIKFLGVGLRHYIKDLPRLKKVQSHLRRWSAEEDSYLELADYIEHLETRINLSNNKIARWKGVRKEYPRYLKYEKRITAIRDWLNI